MAPTQNTRSAFISNVIGALESKHLPTGSDLAARAFSNLHYDYPVVTSSEIHALAEIFRESVGIKDGWFPYRLTTKLTANAVAGASQLYPQLDQQQPESTQDTPAEEVNPAGLQPRNELQGAYCHLCSAILISFMRKALSLPEADAWLLLEHYVPVQDSDGDARVLPGTDIADGYGFQGQGGPETVGSSQPQTDHGGPPEAGLEVAGQALHEAAEPDDDDFAYEDMDDSCPLKLVQPPAPLQSSPLLLPPASAWSLSDAQLEPQGVTGGYSWDELRSRLLHLGSQVTYVAMADPSVWVTGGAAEGLLELLRVLGIHGHAHELQPLLHGYVNLLADRLSDDPSRLPAYLAQLWQALGIRELACAPRSRTSRALPSAATTTGRAGGMPAEASAAFSVITQLASQCTSAPSASGRSRGQGRNASSAVSCSPLVRGELWSQVHTHLLELSARCLEDLAAYPGLGPEQTATISLVCQVLLFYVQHRPGGVDAAKQLLQVGVVRSLAVLLPRCSGGQQAASPALAVSPPGIGTAFEPLRLLMLLCVACSPEVRVWVMAVPGMKAWISRSAELQPGGGAEAHGALWQLLTSNAAAPGKQGAAAPVQQGGNIEDGSDDMLSQLLQSSDLARLQTLLQLMLTVNQAANGRMAWGAEAQARMKSLTEELRCRAAEDATAAAAAVGKAGKHAEGGREESPQPLTEGLHPASPDDCLAAESAVAREDICEEDDLDALKLHGQDPDLLKARRLKLLVPDCMRMLKSLVVSGGKTD